jgi:O-antigen/teichoic acid export membrane protein
MALQFAVGIIPTFVIILALPPLFALVFGPQWGLAGEFGVILAPFYLVGFVAIAVGSALVILENQKLQFLWDVFRTIGTIGVWITASHLHATPMEAMIAYSAFGSLAYLVYIVMALTTTRRYVRKMQGMLVA